MQDSTAILNKAKIGVMQQGSVFLSTVLFSLRFRWDNSIPTAGTNGIDLVVNEDWFTKLTPEARIGLLAHEAWHVAFQHMTRCMGRCPDNWNIAGDHVINLMLTNSGFQLPANGLADKKYVGMSTEQVYDDLIINNDKPQNNPYKDLIYEPPQGKSTEDVNQDVLDTIVKASVNSNMRGDKAGSIPGEIQLELEKLLNPKLPWNLLLHKYMSAMAKDDYSYQRPNRRFLPEYYLPGMYSEALPHVAVAVDTSGSVSDHEFASFISEINQIKKALNPQLVTVVDFDTSIKKIHKLTQTESVQKLKFTGRGGTDLQPVFDYFTDNKPNILIVFSDLYCSPIEDKPKFPVIWVCVNNPKGKVNFGKLIHMEIVP